MSALEPEPNGLWTRFIRSLVIYIATKLSDHSYHLLQRRWSGWRRTYKAASGGDVSQTNMRKVKDHYIDVIMSAVVKPKLSRKADGEEVHIEELFDNWSLAEKLYTSIIQYTYGKKKLK